MGEATVTPSENTKMTQVRDLCRKLKPVIGEQADRIWMAYVAEDETGKEQIRDYLELLYAQKFQGHLESDGPGLIPPKAEDAEGEYRMGNVAYNGKALFPFGLRENEWTQHLGVFGRSGAGKTNLGFLIVQQLQEQKKPFLLFDWKRNYRDLLALPGFEDVAVYTIGRAVSSLSFNPLIPPPETNPQTWLKKLISVVAHAYLLGDGVIFLLQEAIDHVYREHGVYEGKVEQWPTFRDVYDYLRGRDSPGREAGWMSSAMRALSSLCFGEMDVLVNQGSDDLIKLLDRPVILELDALTQSDKVFFIQATLLFIHHYRIARPVREKFEHAILIEEAHHILSNERHSLVGGQSVMEITFREIREFGESMIILDQHPSQISMPALGNTYCTICFNLKHRTDVSAMSQAMLLQDAERDVLGSLQIGQAVVRLQGRGVKPFLIDVPEFEIRKGSITDTHVTYHMTRLGLLSSRKQQIKRTQSVMSAVAGEETLPSRDLGLELLRDIFDFPESGIAERYRRLAISVRQGQKLKAVLVDAKHVLEHTELTNRGRLRVIRLTEQGRLRLSDGQNSDSHHAA